MSLLPIGFKFKPSDEELVRYYLQSKLLGQDFPCNEVVFECDVYGNKEPWEIWEECNRPWVGEEKNKCIYLITPLKKVAAGGSRVNRKVGSSGGTWHGEDSETWFRSEDCTLLWSRRRFKYKNDKGRKDQNGTWLMQEYSIQGRDSLVACRISMKDNKRKLCENHEDVHNNYSNVPVGAMSSEHIHAAKCRRVEDESSSSMTNPVQRVEQCLHQEGGNNFVVFPAIGDSVGVDVDRDDWFPVEELLGTLDGDNGLDTVADDYFAPFFGRNYH